MQIIWIRCKNLWCCDIFNKRLNEYIEKILPYQHTDKYNVYYYVWQKAQTDIRQTKDTWKFLRELWPNVSLNDNHTLNPNPNAIPNPNFGRFLGDNC